MTKVVNVMTIPLMSTRVRIRSVAISIATPLDQLLTMIRTVMGDAIVSEHVFQFEKQIWIRSNTMHHMTLSNLISMHALSFVQISS